MDGLECSEIYLSALERTARIDAEFYKKGNLEVSDFLKEKTLQSFTASFSVSDGNHMSISDAFRNKGIPYYRGQDIYNIFIEAASPVCIDTNTFNHPHMKRSHLKRGDVLMSIVGAIVGNSAIVTSDSEATCSCKLAIMRSKQTDILPEVLLTFIKTKYGQNQIQKFKRGAAQTGLLLEDFDQLLIPIFSSCLQEQIKEVIQSAHDKVVKESEVHEEAKTFLLSALGFDSAMVSKNGISEKLLSESFGTSGRLDAEYYQPKYEDIEKRLNTTESVGTLCDIHDANYVPDEKKDYQYIELANVGMFGNVYGVEKIHGKDLPTRARRKVNKGQVIISSIEGSLQSCALITDDYHNALCSTGFYVIDSDHINSETLLVLFKSEPIQALMKQRCSGTILTAISKDFLLSMPLPLIDDMSQKDIAEKVQKSFALRRQAEKLIATAVRAVEIAIEEDEAAAISYIDTCVD